ncbi:MAG: (d)CMP kinase [Bdellovibrionales bacterium]|nr:(d)CMP kinase [Bdellovibrionales bacterium]
MTKKPVVAIDGPAGSGKSTIARKLAARLGFTHIDTGALYRGVAYLALKAEADLNQEQAVVAAAQGARIEFRQLPEGNLLHINGRNVGWEIRTEDVGAAASKTSAYPAVRAMLLGIQKEMGRSGGVVLEGRDIGTVVFPKAEVKIFLTASIEERSRRRFEELKGKGIATSLEEVRKDMIHRDHQDSSRAVAPMRKADDAIELDTTGLAVESVLDRLESIVKDVQGR